MDNTFIINNEDINIQRILNSDKAQPSGYFPTLKEDVDNLKKIVADREDQLKEIEQKVEEIDTLVVDKKDDLSQKPNGSLAMVINDNEENNGLYISLLNQWSKFKSKPVDIIIETLNSGENETIIDSNSDGESQFIFMEE